MENNTGLIKSMMEGSEQAILKGYDSKCSTLEVNAIIQSVLHGMKSPDVKKRLENLTKNNTCLFGHNAGWRVSDFAYAALDLLGMRKYTGSESCIKKLIQSQLDFD